MALGPGVPDPPSAAVRPATQLSRHQIGGRLVLRVKSILDGLHHEYSLAPIWPDRSPYAAVEMIEGLMSIVPDCGATWQLGTARGQVSTPLSSATFASACAVPNEVLQLQSL